MSAPTLHYPPELLFLICAHVYYSSLFPAESSLDPLILKDYGTPTGLPSTIPSSHWPEPVARRALANLCLVNRAWYEAAKPWLWTKLEVRLPRSWLSLLEEIAWDYDEEKVEAVVGDTLQAATKAAHPALLHKEGREPLRLENILESWGPETSIPLELLSPIATRDSSPSRFRPKSKSPARWKLVRSINDAIRTAMERREPGLYVPSPKDPRPGRFVRHIDFNHFRTIGMRRSIEEGLNSRFVTGDRVQAVLREMPNLTAFGATEYMDGALTLPVLNELFLRGVPSWGRGRPLRGRGIHANDTDQDSEDEERERRQECKDLEAVDLTGCVSAVFVHALTEFVNTHLITRTDAETYDGGHHDSRPSLAARFHEEPLVFPGLLRLGLRGVKSIMPRILTPFVLAFPSLTHLDLSGTRATPELLYALGESPTVCLQSLALARCIKLDGASIKALLIESPVTRGLKELNLYGDNTFRSPLLEDDLRDIITMAPCFLSGNLVYLDISSAPVTRDILLRGCRLQPKLRSLGLSHIPDLELKAIAEFLHSRAPNVEILTLIGTSPDLDCGMRRTNEDRLRGSPRQSSIALHTHLIRPLCSQPFSFSHSMASPPPPPPPTRLRVIELSTIMLGGLGAGAEAWRIVRSKGGRGWYVDTASAWVAASKGSVLRRDLEPGHPYRIEMEKLSKANGNVSSGVGWHARKMEILHGHGMLGREDGLYGAVSFAYQG